MALVLQIFGAAFLLLIALLLVGALVVRAKLRAFARQLEEAVGELGAEASALSPSRIHLRRMARADWADEAAVAALADPLPKLGFTPVGEFQIEEVPGFDLAAWVKPSEGVTAVVYEHPKAGVWIDLVTTFADDTRLTFANTAQGSGVEHSPGHDVQRFDGLSTEELYRKFLAERPRKPFRSIGPDEFVDRFEQAYADEMDWRNSRGGMTEAEIREVARLSGEPIDEETVHQLRLQSETHAMSELGEAVRERFLAQTSMPAAEWEAVRDRIVVIHDKMSQTFFANLLDDLLEDETYPELDDTPESAPRRLFARINQSLPDDLKYKKLGSVAKPVEADVYAAPESDDDEDEYDEDDDD